MSTSGKVLPFQRKSESASSGYSANEVADLLDMPVEKVHGFVDAHFLQPARTENGDHRFTFRDLVLLRTVKGLAQARIPARRIRTVLGKLQQQLAEEQPLSGVALTAESKRILARDGAAHWSPESGQMVFDFDAQRRPAAPDRLHRIVQERSDSRPLDSDEWYHRGCELESSSSERAIEMYSRAVEADPRHADAHINLGRLLHSAAQFRPAEKHYRLALIARPKDPVAAFNLGIALEDLGRPGEAIQAYRDAIDWDAGCADAYFNLARLYEQEGMRAHAIRYLRTYRTLANKR